MRKGWWLAAVALSLAACKDHPIDRGRDASGGGGLGFFGSGNFVVFGRELQSGGGAFLYPTGENQTLSFDDTSNPVNERSIRYFWNGQDANSQHIFVGMDLMHVPLFADYASTPGRDLRAAGYTKVTFYARGSLSTNTLVKIEVSDDGNTGTAAPCVSLSESGTLDGAGAPCGTKGVLSGSWQKYTIPIANSNLASVKDHFKATFVFNPPFPGSMAPGQGGTVYFDQIQYEP